MEFLCSKKQVVKSLLQIPKDIYQVCSKLHEHSFQAYIVGGAIRDALMKKEPKDWDVTTDATPEQVKAIFPKTIPTGEKFGTIIVKSGNTFVDVTTMREDANYSDRRRPDSVKFTSNLFLDLQRRDFTINAIAYDPIKNQIIDIFQGTKDLKRKIIRTVGNSRDRFNEDALRMLRLVRFTATLNFKPHRSAVKAINPELIKNVANERIQDELNKLLVAENIIPALKLLYNSGLLARIIPELTAGAGIKQGKNHQFDVLEHSFWTAQYVKPLLHLRLAALLHDVGKPITISHDETGIHFYKHEQVGAELSKKILKRLAYSRAIQEQVTLLVQEHMFQIHPHSTDKAIRRFIAKVGPEQAYDLIELRKADVMAMKHDPKSTWEYYQSMLARLDSIIMESHAFTVKELAITGSDLIRECQLKPGPLIGQILNQLLDQVLDEPKLNNYETLIAIAKKLVTD